MIYPKVCIEHLLEWWCSRRGDSAGSQSPLCCVICLMGVIDMHIWSHCCLPWPCVGVLTCPLQDLCAQLTCMWVWLQQKVLQKKHLSTHICNGLQEQHVANAEPVKYVYTTYVVLFFSFLGLIFKAHKLQQTEWMSCMMSLRGTRWWDGLCSSHSIDVIPHGSPV